MSRAIRHLSLLAFLVADLLFIFVSCTQAPVDPYQASKAKINLTVKASMLKEIVGSYTDSVGDSINIGITMNLPEFVDSVGVKVCSENGAIEGWTVFKNIGSIQVNDTLWYKMLFKTEGEKSIIAQGYIQQNNNYCDTILINVVGMPAPIITANSMNQSVCLGLPDSFSVTATGQGTLTYQWKNSAGNLSGAHYAGITTNKLTIDTILISDTGTYMCVVTNAMDSSVLSSGAKLSINTYTVKFNDNGGSPVDSQEIFCNSTAIAPPTPNKAGYNFSGWYSDSTLATAFSFTRPITAAITLFARWTINPNIVSFNSNGGSSVSNQTVVYNSPATQPTPAPTKVGYSLAGWYSDSLLMNQFSFSTSITGAIILYAKWILNTYTVSFNSNGGSVVASQTISYNSMAIQPTPSPTKTGNVFSGWYSDSLVTSAFNFSTPITAAITLFARWTINSNIVSFNSNGGSSVSNQAVVYNSTATQPTPAPTKVGYSLAGWYSDSLLMNPFSFSTSITGAITLYAKWILNTYTVSFNSNGGSVVASQTISYNLMAIQPSPSPTKTGYVFSGWYSDSLLTSAFSFSTPITATITLYAKWTTNTFTVSFNSEGGSAVGTQTVAYNTTATQPAPAPTKTGYAFLGWYSDSLLTSAFNFSTPITATITLYAKWTTDTFTVSFNSEGGSAVGTQTVTYNTTATLPTPAPTKNGAIFIKWYSDSFLTTPFNFSTPITAQTTLYAKWASLYDIDGNFYDTVTIGTQMWMVENLKTTRYNDGNAIPLVTDNSAWGNLTTSGYCYYNDSASDGTTYGALYNGYSVNTGKLAPTGWHVPTDSEWTVLITLYGGINLAGGPLKATGITFWASPNTGATNQSGYSALPGGFRDGNGTFEGIGGYGSWWSATAFSATGLWSREVNSSGTNVVRGSSFVGYGFSVRCIRDN